jgi:hypothetical protein
MSESKFTPELLEQYLDLLRQYGLKARCARAVGLHPSSMKRYRKDNPDYDDEVEAAMEDYRESVESEIHRRAIEGIDSPVFYKGELVNTEKRYSDRLLELHAKRHIPAYREKHTVDHNVTGGVLVVPGTPDKSEDWEDDG